jgi:hypothetical protein
LSEYPWGGDARPALVVHDDGTGPVNPATFGSETVLEKKSTRATVPIPRPGSARTVGKAVRRLEPGIETGAGEDDDATLSACRGGSVAARDAKILMAGRDRP